MRKRKYVLLLAGAVCSLCMAETTMAQEVVFSDKEKCPLTVVKDIAGYNTYLEALDAADETGASAVEPDSTLYPKVSEFDALGVVNGKYVAIAYGRGKTGYVPLKEMEDKVPALETEQLPKVEDWTDLSTGASGDRTTQLQQALSGLGLTEGGVDGAFGPGTEASVKAFQTGMGLAGTGIVDASCWFLLLSEAEPNSAESEVLNTSYPPEYKVEDKFRAIADDVQDIEVLKNFLDPKWVFEYDTFEGVGKIDMNKGGITLGSISEGNRAVDRLTLTAKMFVDVRRSDKNVIEVRPVIEIVSSGSQRPYIKSAILRQGYSVLTLEKIFQESSVEGMTSAETTLLAIDENAFDLISGDDVQDLAIRLQGLHGDYDLDVTSKAEEIKEFLLEALNINEQQRHLVIEE